MTRKKSCNICYTPLKTIISSCGCTICPSCWHQMILAKIQETNSLHETISCPSEKCLKRLSITTLSKKFLKYAQEEISQATLKVYLSKTSDIRQCPSTNCNYAGVIDISSSCSDSLLCEACGTTWRDKIHYNSVEKVQNSFNQMTKQKSEIFSELWKKMKTKKCPKCHILIAKNGGCDHMTCSKCRYEFCWVCLQAYKSPAHKKSIHNFEALLKPIISGLLILLAFFLMVYALYILPPINFAIHAIVIPVVQWCGLEIFAPIFSVIWVVFGPILRFCWPFLKEFLLFLGEAFGEAIIKGLVEVIFEIIFSFL